jgi:hypothetical protein
MSEDPQPGAASGLPVSPDAGQNAALPARSRLSGMVAGHLADQARQMAQAARAGRVTSTDSEPGVRDLTPLHDLLAELVEELQKVKPRERIARALRQAADVIDPPSSVP